MSIYPSNSSAENGLKIKRHSHDKSKENIRFKIDKIIQESVNKKAYLVEKMQVKMKNTEEVSKCKMRKK